MRHGRARLSHYWLAARVGLWLCDLPIRLRVHTLPGLLERLTGTRTRAPCDDRVELERTVGIVRRVCRLWLFRGRPFPQACLRQALALYAVLGRMGYPVAIHFGVDIQEETLRGHRGVTVGGAPVGERTRPGVLTRVYSYPATTDRCRRQRPVEDRWNQVKAVIIDEAHRSIGGENLPTDLKGVLAGEALREEAKRRAAEDNRENEEDLFRTMAELWRGKGQACRNLYGFLSQVIPYQDSDFERLYVFLRHLAAKLPGRRSGAAYQFDDEVRLESCRLQKSSEGSISLRDGEARPLDGSTEVGSGMDRTQPVPLSQLIDLVNERFGIDFTQADQLFFDQIVEAAMADDDLR